jgi:uracil phosphoribosyltransferase
MNKVQSEPYINMLLTIIRDNSTQKQEIRGAINALGQIVGRKIYGDHCTAAQTVQTPMQQPYNGLVSRLATTVVLSTRDDHEYFAAGIASIFDGCLRGYMDFAGARGQQALNLPIQAASLPTPPAGQVVSNVIIAKSVLATGCTAVSIARKAIDLYRPEKIFLASTFYSQRGIDEVNHQIYPRPEIYIIGEPDDLNNDGMLIPGIGNLDQRLSS